MKSNPECEVIGESESDMQPVPGTERDPIHDFFFSTDEKGIIASHHAYIVRINTLFKI